MIRQEYFGDLTVFLENTYLLSYDSKSKLRINLYCCLTTILTCVINASLYFSGFKRSLQASLFFSVIGTITIFQQIFLTCNQKNIKNLLQVLYELQQRHSQKWEKNIFEKDSKRIWQFLYKYYYFITRYMYLYIIFPNFGDFILGYINPEFISIRVPLPGQGYIDVTEPRSLNNFFFTIVGCSYSVSLTVIYLGTEGFILTAITYTKTELKLLNQKILLMKQKLNKKLDSSPNLFQEITKHHQILLITLENLKRVIGFPVAIKNTTISICTCLNLFALTVYLSTRGDYSTIIQSSVAMCCLNIILLILCTLGESLETENREILYNLYDLPWHELKPDARKHLNMMIRQAKKPFVINYHRRANLNLHGFMQIINSSYSYFMMLKSTVR